MQQRGTRVGVNAMTVKTRRRESRRLECLTAAGRVFAYSQEADKQQTRRIQYVASRSRGHEPQPSGESHAAPVTNQSRDS